MHDEARTEHVTLDTLNSEVVGTFNAALLPYLKPIAELALDPKNARRRTLRNLSAIKYSLTTFGQQKPIVAGLDGVVRAGNGLLEAARELGWSHVAVVPMDGNEQQLEAFAIADNRSAELAEWNDDTLTASLDGLLEHGFDLVDMGFTRDEVDALVSGGQLKFEADEEGTGLADEAQKVRDQATIVISVSRDGANDATLKRDLESFCVKHGLNYRVRF